MHTLIALLRHALRAGNGPLAAAVSRALRADPLVREQADAELRGRPRSAARWSAAAERVVDAVAARLYRER